MNGAAHPAIPAELDAFVTRFRSVVEHSPWVAEQAFADGPFADSSELHAAFERALLGATREQQFAVLLAHPELATTHTKPVALTAESASEQAGAGLDRLAEEQRLALASTLAGYRERFGFPFIACMRDHGGASIDQLVGQRLPGEREVEFAVALHEVSRIAHYRLVDLVDHQ